MFVSSGESYAEVPTPNVMVLEGRTLGGDLVTRVEPSGMVLVPL